MTTAPLGAPMESPEYLSSGTAALPTGLTTPGDTREAGSTPVGSTISTLAASASGAPGKSGGATRGDIRACGWEGRAIPLLGRAPEVSP